MQKTLFHLSSAAVGLSVGLASAIVGAVNVSTDGTGEALIYPYYTVRNGQSTLISVTNNHERGKALKVAFREGRNGVNALSFNLFLAPNDTWTAAIVRSNDGALLVSNDTSCTNPRIPSGGVEFRNQGFAADASGLSTLDRTREGYLEIVEMASVAASSRTEIDITPNAAGTRACEQVNNTAVNANAQDYLAPTGKLSGNGTLVSPSMSTGYDALALQGLDLPTVVTTASDEAPTGFSTARSKTAVINFATNATSYTAFADFDRTIDAISAVLMAESLRGGYSAEPSFTSDWVVAFPTKSYYVNRPASESVQPFASRWNPTTGKACEVISLSLRTRDGSTVSPSATIAPELCFATSPITFQRSAGALPSAIGSAIALQVPIDAVGAAQTGIVQLSLQSSANQTPRLRSNASSRLVTHGVGAAPRETFGVLDFYGLPAVGTFIASAQFANGNNNFNSSGALSTSRRVPTAQ